MDRFKLEQITSPPENLMIIIVLYHLLLVIGDFILFGGFKLGD